MNELTAPVGERSARAQATQILDAWHCGESPDTLAALERFPQLRLDQSVVLDLAYEEYCLLRERGAVEPEQFCDRYPIYRAALLRLIESHRRLEAKSIESYWERMRICSLRRTTRRTWLP